MRERWRAISDFEGSYEVSDRGRVRSLDRMLSHGHRRRGRVLRLRSVGNYVGVQLCNAGVARNHYVHRLVLKAFRGPCPEGMEGCHDDGNRENNQLDNLRWDTRTANHADKIGHGTSNRGSRHGNAKYTEGDAERILDLRRHGCSYSEIGGWLGMADDYVGRVVRGDRWGHLQRRAA